jgi:hypothetical protein
MHNTIPVYLKMSFVFIPNLFDYEQVGQLGNTNQAGAFLFHHALAILYFHVI